jgi:hypothetical protein
MSNCDRVFASLSDAVPVSAGHEKFHDRFPVRVDQDAEHDTGVSVEVLSLGRDPGLASNALATTVYQFSRREVSFHVHLVSKLRVGVSRHMILML